MMGRNVERSSPSATQANTQPTIAPPPHQMLAGGGEKSDVTRSFDLLMTTESQKKPRTYNTTDLNRNKQTCHKVCGCCSLSLSLFVETNLS